MKHRGFTLVELLAVIVLLAIILAITVPGITSAIRSSSKSSMESDAKLVLKAADYQKLKDSSFNITSLNKDTVSGVLGLSNANYQSLKVTLEDNIAIITIVGQNKWAGFIACGSYWNMRVVESTSDCSNDLIPPVITLLGDSLVNINIGDIYSDAGATASDNKDGNISNMIITTGTVNPSVPGTYTITYQVADTAGNTRAVTRTVNVIDNVAPVITTLGSNPINVNMGSTYNDAGATALDNADGDITNKITTTGTVNPNVPGTYTITYTVSDTAGNVATAIRTVNVIVTDYESSKGVNRPRLATGMTAIKWVGTTEQVVSNPDTDTSWYDYANKQWANAKTADGSYWVWIPRYAYKITSGYHTSSAGNFDIVFLQNKTTQNSGSKIIETSGYLTGVKDTSANYFLHPAFNQGGVELTGFWVAKFEPSGTSTNINIVPNASSLRYNSPSSEFDMSLNLKNNSKYGWNASQVDTHLITNYEWGAVVYLSKSTNGANAEVWMNSNSNFTTGCAGNSLNAAGSATCNAYNTTLGQNASTTYNITGIYDMNGGAAEQVAAYVNNGNSNLNQATNIVNANTRYKNIYPKGAADTMDLNYAAAKNIYGDAIYETSSSSSAGSNSAWFGDYSMNPADISPWFLRGFDYEVTNVSGLFCFTGTNGYGQNWHTFRPVFSVND